jgi:hypothetical protein
MAKIVVGLPSLTQGLLLYPGLGPAMLFSRSGLKKKQEGIGLSVATQIHNR